MSVPASSEKTMSENRLHISKLRLTPYFPQELSYEVPGRNRRMPTSDPNLHGPAEEEKRRKAKGCGIGIIDSVSL